jgi:hypothetical protein
MQIKSSVSFLTKDSDEKLIISVGAILTALTGNVRFPTPAPTLPVITASLDAFSIAVTNAVDAGRVERAIKREKRAALVALMRQLASYVQVTANNDLAVFLSSGFPVQKTQREPIGVLPAPANLTVTFGPRSGELRAAAGPVSGAAIFNWRISTAANPNVVVQALQTTAANCTFNSLTPGVVYQVEANVVGSAGPSDWTEPVPQMAV